MALTRNGRSVFQNPGSFQGLIAGHVGNFIKGGLRNRNAGGFQEVFSAYPNGTLTPSTFILAQKSGSISSYTLSSGSINGSSVLIPGVNLSGASALILNITNAQLDQIVSAIGSGSISINTVSAILAGAAALQSDGSVVITVTSAICGAIVSTAAAASGSINGNGSPLTARGFMEATAGGATPLSPEGLAASLLDNNDIETGYSMRESLRIIVATLAGKISGAGGATITVRDINDTVDRIVASVDSNGNRTSLTVDPN